MTKFRTNLPQLGERLFVSDGGIETSLIYHQGLELPLFASFVLLKTAEGRAALRRYFADYTAIARRGGHGFILESPTWRASRDWGPKLGYSIDDLADANRQAIALLAEIATESGNAAIPMVISGCIGPRGDGYDPGKIMEAAEAEDYHAWQVDIFKQTAADMVSAITMTNMPEAIGLARAARKARMPAVISFTVETDGNLPTGQGLADAIAETDAATGASPAYYMINCAHPTHFENRLKPGESWTKRIRGIRANASRCSHAELDKATELDAGNPAELGRQYRSLRQKLPHLTVLGGCCGTDHRHIGAIAEDCKLAA